MKNLLKYFNALAIALILGTSVTNVNAAAACPDGTKLHTNYYLFLESYSVEGETGFKAKLEAALEANSYYSRFTESNKYVNIRSNPIAKGYVGVHDENDWYALPSGMNAPDIEWTTTEFWEKFYEAYNCAENKNQLVCTQDDTSYLLHDKWYEYEDGFNSNAQLNDSETFQITTLIEYIGENIDDLESSDLVTKGTVMPFTTIIKPDDEDFEESSDSFLPWRIQRDFNDDFLDVTGAHVGFYYNGDPSQGENKQIYAPAAYWVEFCVEDDTSDVGTGGGNAQTPATGQYTITYNANGGKDAPATQTGSTGTCQYISSAKPTLEKNTFLGWSTDKDAKEPDKNYEAGDQYCGANGNITLYAVWQVQSGVSAHVIGFTMIGLAAGAALLVAKKKNLFKQI